MSSNSAPSVKTLEESLRHLTISSSSSPITTANHAEPSTTEPTQLAPISKFTISAILNDPNADAEDYAAATMVPMTCIHEAWNSKGLPQNDFASDVHYYFTVLKRWPDGLEEEHMAASILFWNDFLYPIANSKFVTMLNSIATIWRNEELPEDDLFLETFIEVGKNTVAQLEDLLCKGQLAQILTTDRDAGMKIEHAVCFTLREFLKSGEKREVQVGNGFVKEKGWNEKLFEEEFGLYEVRKALERCLEKAMSWAKELGVEEEWAEMPKV